METSEIEVGKFYQNVHVSDNVVRVISIENDTVEIMAVYEDHTDMERETPMSLKMFAKHYAPESEKIFHDSEWFGDNRKKAFE